MRCLTITLSATAILSVVNAAPRPSLRGLVSHPGDQPRAINHNNIVSDATDVNAPLTTASDAEEPTLDPRADPATLTALTNLILEIQPHLVQISKVVFTTFIDVADKLVYLEYASADSNVASSFVIDVTTNIWTSLNHAGSRVREIVLHYAGDPTSDLPRFKKRFDELSTLPGVGDVREDDYGADQGLQGGSGDQGLQGGSGDHGAGGDSDDGSDSDSDDDDP